MSAPVVGQEAPRTSRSKKGAVNVSTGLGSSTAFSPTSFFIRSERDLECDVNRVRRGSDVSAHSSQENSACSQSHYIKDSSFGVQSLEDTLASAFGSEDMSKYIVQDATPAHAHDRVSHRADRGGQAKILASGFSTESPTNLSLGRSCSINSLVSAGSSLPSVPTGSLSASNSPSVNISHNITPLRMSPQADSALAGVSRSASPKSFRLSDDGSSAVDDHGSQAIHSDEEEEGNESENQEHGNIYSQARKSNQPSDTQSQFVMPSLALPTRRPFTERGRQMGKFKVMVVGRSGVGKTSLIQSLLRVGDDIVHADAPSISEKSNTFPRGNGFIEISASTKPKPHWWIEPRHSNTNSRRKSFSGGLLERNLSFVDCPPTDTEQSVRAIQTVLRSSLDVATAMSHHVSDGELLQMLSGKGSPLVDAIIWLFNVDAASENGLSLTPCEEELLQMCAKFGNVVPLLGRADEVTATELDRRKTRLHDLLANCPIYALAESGGRSHGADHAHPSEPFAVSSALSDDLDTIDASVLMSSQYIQPLVDSDLQYFSQRLFDPDNVARMRHLAAVKMFEWRGCRAAATDIEPHDSASRPHTMQGLQPESLSDGSGNDGVDKAMVTYHGSSYYRSTSPSISEISALSTHGPQSPSYSPHAFTDNRNLSPGPFRQVRMAKWAQDLQRSLENERRRYQRMCGINPSEWHTEEGENTHDHALVPSKDGGRPQRGRLGGAVAIIDPRDPLGILAWSQAISKRSRFMFQLAGSFGLVGVLALWVVRNWSEVQEVLGQSSTIIHASAIPAPTKNAVGWSKIASWREFLGWDQ